MSTPGALEEVDWLRNKLETLEKALKESIPGKNGSQSLSVRAETDTLVIPDSPQALELPTKYIFA